MGNTANSCLCLRDQDVVSSQQHQHQHPGSGDGSLDPLVAPHYLRPLSSSCSSSNNNNNCKAGQLHLMYKKGRSANHGTLTTTTASASSSAVGVSSSQAAGRFHNAHLHQPTCLIVRKNPAARGNNSGGGDGHASASNNNNTNNNTNNSVSTHIYAVRKVMEEQRPPRPTTPELVSVEAYPPTCHTANGDSGNGSNGEQHENQAAQAQQQSLSTTTTLSSSPHLNYLSLSPAELFTPAAMAPKPSLKVPDWVVVSDELQIYVLDTGLTPAECNHLVSMTEQACKGQYAAYTYAKQTLGCRDYHSLAVECWPAVHRVTHAIQTTLATNSKTSKTTSSAATTANHKNNNKCSSSSSSNKNNDSSNDSSNDNGTTTTMQLKLDEREPHIVKYDVSKKERQKLDMHTDKSEWTFLISLSDGCGCDYEGGGTYFEALEATIHVQRGHALVFPGKLRHCGQRITKGVRFLLVGFLVDANATPTTTTGGGGSKTTTTTTTTSSGVCITTTTTRPSSSNVSSSSSSGKPSIVTATA